MYQDVFDQVPQHWWQTDEKIIVSYHGDDIQ